VGHVQQLPRSRRWLTKPCSSQANTHMLRAKQHKGTAPDVHLLQARLPRCQVGDAHLRYMNATQQDTAHQLCTCQAPSSRSTTAHTPCLTKLSATYHHLLHERRWQVRMPFRALTSHCCCHQLSVTHALCCCKADGQPRAKCLPAHPSTSCAPANATRAA
jgi:hypothetical protein